VDLTRYAIGGVAPRQAVRPVTRDEAGEALRAASRDGLGVVPWGGSVALPFEAAPERYDLALDLSALDSLVEYEPADLTLTAECGVTLAALRSALAAHGQELPLEAAFADRATLGGVLAANASGPRRRRFGAPRDRILGARYLLGDGSGARTGGKVVKNVAGYGVHRLLCGSRGGLAVITQASLKLMPAPARRVALIWKVESTVLSDRARWQALHRLELAALSVASTACAKEAGLGGDAPFVVIAGLEDDEARVAELEGRLTAGLGAPDGRREGHEALALWQALADLEERPGARVTLATPDTTPAALAAMPGLAPDLALVFHAPAGRLHLWPGPGELQALGPGIASGAFVAIDARPAGAMSGGPAAPLAVGAMRRALRSAIDPAARFALGESWVHRAL